MPKPTTTTGISTADDFKRDLIEKVKSWGLVARRKRGLPPGSAAAPGSNAPPPPKRLYPGDVTLRAAAGVPGKVDCLAIGSSTGGPQALFALFRALGRGRPDAGLRDPAYAGDLHHDPGRAPHAGLRHAGAEAKDGEALVGRAASMWRPAISI